MKNNICVKDIISKFSTDIIKIDGSIKNKYITNICDSENINSYSLDWINSKKKDKQQIAEKSKANIIIVDPEVKYSEKLLSQGKALIYVKNPRMVIAKIGVEYFEKKVNPEIHKTAIIDSDANIGQNVFIGPYSVIGKCKIGNSTVIDSNVRLFDNVEIGDDCVIKSGAVIGSAGYGFERDENGNMFHFPQIGGVIIGNHVEIGANTCIDRGALSDTVIGDYTKINNLVHIAHNVKTGKNVAITAHAIISGSCIIEDNVWIAPAAAVRGWIHIGEKSLIGLGAVLTKNIGNNEVWAGNPAKFLRKAK
jgi:UDP-3-O-[3-hydroxymyristoyl] glucosamine N-acyltransferase